jgi:hypothetical protein
MTPDRVLSLTVLVLALLLMSCSGLLYYTRAAMSRSGAMITIISNQTVEKIQANRLQPEKTKTESNKEVAPKTLTK